MNLLKNLKIQNLLALILISALIWAVHTITLPEQPNQYGYDYGFYSYTAGHTVNTAEYFLGQDDDYGNHLFLIFAGLSLPKQASLETSFFVFSILAGWLIFFNLKRYSLLAATFGVLLFALSIPQALATSMFLWKNLYGQVLLLATFYLLQQNKTFWELIPLSLLLITHKTTSLLAMAATAGHYLIIKSSKHRWIILIMVGAGLIVFAIWLNGYEYIARLAQSSVSDGIFFKPIEYLAYSWYLLPLASWGIYHSWKQKLELPWLMMLAACLLIIIFQGLFYQRLILFADLALIYFSALSLHYWKTPRSYKVAVAIVVTLVSAWQLHNFSQRLEPRISVAEIQEIQQFAQTHQGAFVLAVSSQDGPWLLGNLEGNIRLAAPGLFEDKLTADQWKEYWINPQDKDFLTTFPQPLYLYQRSMIVYQEAWGCLEPSSEHFYKYVCK